MMVPLFGLKKKKKKKNNSLVTQSLASCVRVSQVMLVVKNLSTDAGDAGEWDLIPG